MSNFQPQPKIVAARASVYTALVVAPKPLAKIEPLPEAERRQVISDLIHEALPLEGAFLRAQGAQARAVAATGVPNHDIGRDLAMARQKLNTLISLRKHHLAAALGITESQFLRDYLPKGVDGLWFCRDTKNYASPVDFLRAELAKLPPAPEPEQPQVEVEPKRVRRRPMR